MLDKEAFLKFITCKLTRLIFSDPVLAEDGNIYEFLAIKNWYMSSQTSPITGKEMGGFLTRIPSLKELIKIFLSSNPEYVQEQFLYKKPFNLFEKEFFDLIAKKDFSKLKIYTNFKLNQDLGNQSLISFAAKNLPDDIIIHIINNSDDWEVSDNYGNKPLHTICQYSTSEVIKVFVDKNIDINSKDKDGRRFICNLVIYHSNDLTLFRYILDKSVDLNFSAEPLHLIISFGNLALLMLFLEYGLSMNTQSKSSMTLLQYTFRWAQDPELVKYIIEQNINIDVDPDPTITCEQLLYQNDKLTKKDKQPLVLLYLKKVLNRPIVIEDYMFD